MDFHRPILIFSVYSVLIFTPLFILQRCIFHQPQLPIRKKDLICFVIPAIYLIVLFNSEENKILHILAMLIVIAHNLPYVGIIYHKIRKHQKRIEIISSNTESINLQWLIKLSFLLFITIIITVCYELFNTFIYKMHQNLVMDLLFLFIVYSTFIMFCDKRKSIL